jgi:hypothetical protein
MRVVALLCFLPAFISHATAAPWQRLRLGQQRQLVLDRKPVGSEAYLEDNALHKTGLSFSSARAEEYRIKERLPDIDGPLTFAWDHASC